MFYRYNCQKLYIGYVQIWFKTMYTMYVYYTIAVLSNYSRKLHVNSLDRFLNYSRTYRFAKLVMLRDVRCCLFQNFLDNFLVWFIHFYLTHNCLWMFFFYSYLLLFTSYIHADSSIYIFNQIIYLIITKCNNLFQGCMSGWS